MVYTAYQNIIIMKYYIIPDKQSTIYVSSIINKLINTIVAPSPRYCSYETIYPLLVARQIVVEINQICDRLELQ